MVRVKPAGGLAPTTPLKLTSPAVFRAAHLVAQFDCGEPSLNAWLQNHALSAGESRTAQTFVVCRGRRVVGYYSLASGAIAHAQASSSLRRNTPDPIPAIVLARLAVATSEQGKDIGPHLLRDAKRRCLTAARHVAARTLVVHALDEQRAKFYRKFGFLDLKTSAQPADGTTIPLHIPLDTIAKSLAS